MESSRIKPRVDSLKLPIPNGALMLSTGAENDETDNGAQKQSARIVEIVLVGLVFEP